ncbi:hypothetical protein MN202_13965 [Rheinheimera muenzenbergensis]|uniref:Lipoprotein n=1 Tax=Rheinheimera muenzenbergensis TaxID=1193628 RepID=A0ABU8C908_9GAMM
MRTLILAAAVLTLCACSQEDVETANFGSDYYKAEYQLSNATTLELDFYMANAELNGEKRKPYQDKYKVAHLAQQQDSTLISHEHNSGRQVSFYVHAPYSGKGSYSQTYKVKRKHRYHWLAWMSGEALTHSLIEQRTSNQPGVIRIRLFATAASLEARQQAQTVRLQLGTVSDYLSVTQCDGGLRVNEQAIDLCDASFGYSYLLVVGSHGRIALIPQ